MRRADQIYHRLEDLPSLNWSRLESAGEVSREVLAELAADRSQLRSLVAGCLTNPRLAAMTEHFERIDRFVLYDDLSRGIRIRLHIYPPKHFDGPHDHRWSFSSIVLRGGYKHSIYAGMTVDGTTPVLEAEPNAVRYEPAGATYTLHHSIVHSVIALPGTVSLILRGPAEKERLMMTDLRTGRLRWKYGVERESAAERAPRAPDPAQLRALMRHLSDEGLL